MKSNTDTLHRPHVSLPHLMFLLNICSHLLCYPCCEMTFPVYIAVTRVARDVVADVVPIPQKMLEVSKGLRLIKAHLWHSKYPLADITTTWYLHFEGCSYKDTRQSSKSSTSKRQLALTLTPRQVLQVLARVGGLQWGWHNSLSDIACCEQLVFFTPIFSSFHVFFPPPCQPPSFTSPGAPVPKQPPPPRVSFSVTVV